MQLSEKKEVSLLQHFCIFPLIFVPTSNRTMEFYKSQLHNLIFLSPKVGYIPNSGLGLSGINKQQLFSLTL